MHRQMSLTFRPSRPRSKVCSNSGNAFGTASASGTPRLSAKRPIALRTKVATCSCPTGASSKRAVRGQPHFAGPRAALCVCDGRSKVAKASASGSRRAPTSGLDCASGGQIPPTPSGTRGNSVSSEMVNASSSRIAPLGRRSPRDSTATDSMPSPRSQRPRDAREAPGSSPMPLIASPRRVSRSASALRPQEVERLSYAALEKSADLPWLQI